VNPTDVLKREHRVIERALAALEVAAERLLAGERVDPAFFLRAAEFIKEFADGCHHHKEEGVLFPAMQEAGVPVEGGPIGVMLEEHEEGRRLSAAMREGAMRLGAGAAEAGRDTAENALGYVALLRGHILKEDNVLFPMAEEAIPLRAGSDVAEAIARIEREESDKGLPQRYLALADALERDASR